MKNKLNFYFIHNFMAYMTYLPIREKMERNKALLRIKEKTTEETFHESLTSCWAVDILPPSQLRLFTEDSAPMGS